MPSRSWAEELEHCYTQHRCCSLAFITIAFFSLDLVSANRTAATRDGGFTTATKAPVTRGSHRLLLGLMTAGFCLRSNSRRRCTYVIRQTRPQPYTVQNVLK
ncbi:hypothetical protein VTN96DRAFT_2940 [Rasamsonia emersonii]